MNSAESPVRIEKKITGFTVKKEEVAPGAVVPAPVTEVSVSEPVQLNETVSRPEKMVGETYKIKNPLSESALYVTINDIVLNEGTDHEERRPFEIFINSKNMEHFQWVAALTLVISAVFRKGGDVTFLVEELKSVFDPRGGYWKPGAGVFMNSTVAHIGAVIEDHLVNIGLLKKPGLDEHQRKLIAEKRAQYANEPQGESEEFPASATLCAKCSKKAVIIMDGCATCLNCGDSKCQ